ncbi:MAG: ATP-binding protein [Bdellovibrionaceae bacterium]|nr:ATP-binding protein [Pseudobdellovibrionaceae bacterium]MBX3033341.1 ATP-binding protein [Pseudobdellovibrionaceae bacterium]
MKQVKIVVTGGPSGGKTTLIEGLKKDLGPHAALVPEAASILYRGGFPRLKQEAAQEHAQRAIYLIQKELEGLVADINEKSQLLVCDRGSLDGIAYWPRGESHFFKALKSSRRKELKRYDWVIHLDTASRNFYDTTNPIRTESFSEALKLNERVKKAWRDHPRRIVITQNEDFLSKMTLSLSVIRAILDGRSYEEILSELLSG